MKPRSTPITTDVIVIGAGAAGLAAASVLERRGKTALVLEARERIGGRLCSHHEPGLPVPIELGGEFVHGLSRATFAVLEQTGTAAVDTGGGHWTLRDGRLAPTRDLFAEIKYGLRRTRALDAKDMAFDLFLDRHLKREISAEALAYARMLAQGFDAADTARASARSIVEEWTGGGSVEAPQFRPMGGYGALLAGLANRLRGSSVGIQLDTIVQAVHWKRGAVRVSGTFMGRPFEARAKRAIVTLPLGVLQQSAGSEGFVRFTPALREKRKAMKFLAPGPVLKVLLRFRRAFWDELDRGRYRDVAFFHAREASFPTMWTALPVRTPLLVAWAAGPKAQRLAAADESSIISEAIASVRATFGVEAPVEDLLQGAWVHDWQSDPYARGAYSYVIAGGGEARSDLAKPLMSTLFFAGEAADTEGEAGTVGGALQSGERAAREVLG